jgi:hypothetical protein
LPAAQRKSHFSKAGNREGRCFPTDLVFTFYFYQHVVDVGGGYELDVGLHRWAVGHCNGWQPSATADPRSRACLSQRELLMQPAASCRLTLLLLLLLARSQHLVEAM